MRCSFLIADTSSKACSLVISLVLILNGVFSCAEQFNGLNKVCCVFMKAFSFDLLGNDANGISKYVF